VRQAPARLPVEIRDDTGRVLGEREVGRIFVRGPSLMAGYFDDPKPRLQSWAKTDSWTPATWATGSTANS
jgi:acyl-CoA synthetase (AMP-forming)/AMP-acid ligase II